MTINQAPTFGYETSNHHYIGANVTKSYHQYNEYANNLREVFPKIPVKNLTREEVIKKIWRQRNIKKVVGYFPLLGILVGIGRVIRLAKNSNPQTPKTYIAKQTLRGTVEFLSLGFLLIIPDILSTVLRTSLNREAVVS